jgi:hypothetical protein
VFPTTLFPLLSLSLFLFLFASLCLPYYIPSNNCRFAEREREKAKTVRWLGPVRDFLYFKYTTAAAANIPLMKRIFIPFPFPCNFFLVLSLSHSSLHSTPLSALIIFFSRALPLLADDSAGFYKKNVYTLRSAHFISTDDG